MSRIHFLNVKEGDCNIIEHRSGRITMIDVCCARKESEFLKESTDFSSTEAVKGNFKQKEHPENPIRYLKNRIGKKGIFRYIQSHPDMDHMDGLKDLFEVFDVTNFWDTANDKILEEWGSSRYRREDWDFYQNIRKSKERPKVLQLYSGALGEFYNKNAEGDGSGDGLYVLAPTKKLIDGASDLENYNVASYVILYRVGKFKIIFSGDSDDKSWDYILKEHKEDVSNVDLLVAPHHGRKSGGNDDYLDVLRPKLTLFGNAKSKDLDYNSYYRRNLPILTNNQAGNILIDIVENMKIYVTNESYARKYNKCKYDESLEAYLIGELT